MSESRAPAGATPNETLATRGEGDRTGQASTRGPSVDFGWALGRRALLVPDRGVCGKR